MPTPPKDVATPKMTNRDKAISATTKVNLGILGSMLICTATACWWLGGVTSDFESSVERVDGSLQGVKQALDRNTAQLVKDGLSLAETRVFVDELRRRVRELEKRD